jgi:dihydrofolate synthase/folylpolyglutamate synthase
VTFAKLHNKSDDPKIEAHLDDLLAHLSTLHHENIDLSLARVERFLSQLGDPHLRLPPVIHVAGTNGKGSIIACLRALLEANSKTVHIVTSPHLVHPTERLILAGKPISSEELIAVLEACLTVNRNDPITFFEMLIAASFLAMSRIKADYVLLETGMGGRLDATNVIPDPILTIINTISMDHTEFLGDRADLIAAEKAGIMKPGVPCIIGKQLDGPAYTNINKVFQKISQGLSPEAPLYQCGADWHIAPNPEGFTFTWQDESIGTSHTNMLGTHQMYNIGAALAAYRLIMGDAFDPKILSPKASKKPLLKINWPGRLQWLKDHPFNNLIRDTNKIFIDGGHNDSAGEMLAKQVEHWNQTENQKIHLVVSMVDRKDPVAFLKSFIPFVESLTLTTIPTEKDAYSIDSLKELIEPLGFKTLKTAPTPEAALKNLDLEPNATILMTGSLYFVGHILALK